jgi:uncharacterized protein involved in exopolysaccharide biosynthesis
VDIREQTRAMVDAGAKLEGELIATRGELDSLKQVYGEENVRVKAARTRASDLQREIAKLGGTSAPLHADGNASKGEPSAPAVASDILYPPLRQLPRLAVVYADLYRKVRVREAVYDLLTQQYEVARIQEAKDVPVVSVIDAPGVPEKKAFPPRLLLASGLTAFVVILAGAGLLFIERWKRVSVTDPRRMLFSEISETVRDATSKWTRFARRMR